MYSETSFSGSSPCKKQHLRHDQIGHLVVDGRAKKDDVVA